MFDVRVPRQLQLLGEAANIAVRLPTTHEGNV